MMAAALASCTVRFVTGNDGKDSDTHLTVYLRKANGTIVATIDGQDFGLFGSNNTGDNTTINIPINTQFTTDDLAGSQLVVHIDPNGSDHWDFDCYLTLIFGDGSNHQNSFLGHWLDENTRENQFNVA
jgi:hypothetical protein